MMDNNNSNNTKTNIKQNFKYTMTENKQLQQTMTEVYELSELILDEQQPWQVHNCKLLKLKCSNQGRLPFIYHYDRLPDHLKLAYPLTGTLLMSFNKTMTASEACSLIGVDKENIAKPKFVKIVGTIVIFNEPLQLAIRLHWSNSIKSEDAIYCKNNKQAIAHALENWVFLGRIDTLYKSDKLRLVVNNPQAIIEEDSQYLLPISAGYQLIPSVFAISLLKTLHNQDSKLNWIDEAIKIHVN